MLSIFRRCLDSRDSQERIQIEFAREEIAKIQRLTELREDYLVERGRVLKEVDDAFARKRACVLKELRVLRTRWNSTVPIARLPAEIVTMIFEEYVADHWRTYVGQSSRIPYSWFTILHICREWRRIAFCTHTLWTCLIPASLPCTTFVLSHSGSMSLTVRFGHYLAFGFKARIDLLDAFQLALPAYRMVLQELQRIRVAEIRMSTEVQTFLLELEKQRSGLSMPMMRDLQLFMNDGVDISLFSRADLSHLVSLGLHKATPEAMKSSIRLTLTNLEVDLNNSGYAVDVVVSLQQLPLLRRLTVSSIRPNTDPELLQEELEFESLDVHARLPNLEYLRIEAHPFSATQLLDSVFFPLDATIELVFTNEYRYNLMPEDLMPLIVSKTLRSDDGVADASYSRLYPHRLHFRDSMMELNAELWTTRCPDQAIADCSQAVHDGRPRLSFTGSWDNYFPVTAVRNFMASLPELPAMRLVTDSADTDEYKSVFNGILCNLERLHLYDEPCLILALAAPFRQRSHSLGTGLPSLPIRHLFPKLKVIEIKDAVFHSEPQQESKSPFFLKIIACLRSRAAHGYKIEKLQLSEAVNLSSGDIAVLEEYVGSVEVIDEVFMEEESWASGSWEEDEAEQEDEWMSSVSDTSEQEQSDEN
ncbi:hypothetical protein NM688_g2419 [Phlebia brevispora]|uniref:Uncharacterized protein n=1 Tax=Phlebia brevispora TaxID=194682 RepID=A0ACC1T9B9_9APHY|nr:hypothetical protein NM688_g2419 [Phlebia brevispora]